jgi:hypothetical protein
LSNDFYSISTLILTAIAVKWCMVIGARPRVCAVFFNEFNDCFNSRRWTRVWCKRKNFQLHAISETRTLDERPSIFIRDTHFLIREDVT